MNSIIKKLRYRKHSFASTPNLEVYQATQSGLSVTPSEIAKLTERGIPVSSSNASLFIDGVVNPSFDLPLDQMRGTDVVDVWDASETSKKKLRSLTIE